MLKIFSWIAIVFLSISYWFQIWKIHVHREVRDISLTSNIVLAVGFGILTFTAYEEHSVIFFVKQVATTIPVLIIIFQVIYHRKDRWYDPDMAFCPGCKEVLEKRWKFCPFCGTERKNRK